MELLYPNKLNVCVLLLNKIKQKNNILAIFMLKCHTLIKKRQVKSKCSFCIFQILFLSSKAYFLELVFFLLL